MEGYCSECRRRFEQGDEYYILKKARKQGQAEIIEDEKRFCLHNCTDNDQEVVRL